MSAAPAPLISVVAPFHNRAAWLGALLETLQRQTCADFEVIIVDDGSTDGLDETLARLSSPLDVRIVRLVQNRGGGAARNAGIDAARGRYLALLDSDDAWLPDKLALHLNQFETAPDPDMLVGLSRQCVTGPHPYVRPRRLMTRADKVGFYLFQKNGVIQSSAIFLATALARRARFAEERGGEDWTFALRLEALGARFEMLPQALTYYRDDPQARRTSLDQAHRKLDWLKRHRAQLGDQPYRAARAAFAARSPKRRFTDLGAIVSALVHGAAPPWRCAYYLGVWSFPRLGELGLAMKQALQRPQRSA